MVYHGIPVENVPAGYEGEFYILTEVEGACPPTHTGVHHG